MTARRTAVIPVAVVLLSLLSLIVLPLLVQRRINELRSTISAVADPARDLVTEIQLALALEVAGSRGFLLTGEPGYAASHQEARARRTQAYARLLPLTRRLGPRVHAEAVGLGKDLRPTDALIDSLFSGRLPAARYMGRLPLQQARFQGVTESIARLDRAISREAAARWTAIRATERLGTVLTAVLVLLAVVAALLVARLGRAYRLLAERRDVQVRRQAALREVAGELSAAVSVREAVQTVAERTVSTIPALGAYVERVEVPEPGSDVEVVAVAGDGVPPLGTRVPYPGSLCEEIIEAGGAGTMTEVGAIGERMAPYLRERCRGCSGLAVSLASEGRVLGALVVLRGPGQADFTPEESGDVRALGDLASAALRRVLLLEEIDRERRARAALLHSTDQGISAVDAEGRFTFVNRAAARMLGYTPEEMLGRNAHALVHGSRPDGSDYPAEECPISSAYRTGEGVRVDTEVLWRKDGTAFPVEYSSAPIVADGAVQGAVVAFTDITERKRTEAERAALLARERGARGEAERRAREEEALRRATEAMTATYTVEETIRQIAESALRATGADGAFVERVDLAQQRLVVLAAAGERTPEVGSSVPYEGSFTERLVEGVEPLLIGDLAAAERPLPHDLARTCGNCTAVVVPLLNGGKVVGALFLLNAPERPAFRPDEIARAETFGRLAALALNKVDLLEDSERKREELERVTESRARLMRGFTHDVKNPLGAADGHLQLLEEGIIDHLTETQKESVGRARRSIRAALALIDDLVGVARAEAGRVAIEREPTEVRDAVQLIAEEYRAQAGAAGLYLSVEIAAEVPAIQSDPARIRQILGNLLSNAVKYTDQGGITVRVAVREGGNAPGRGRWIAVDVSDTGPGIPGERQGLLFREFARLEPGAKPGAGIGLAIGRRIARALGGDITMESEVGKGSTFTLWLPLEPPGSGAERKPQSRSG